MASLNPSRLPGLGAALCALLCAQLLALPRAALAQDDAAALERRVKAAFLYKFADYVEWPEGAFPKPNSPVVIGVAGDDQVAAELANVAASRPGEGHPVVVKKLREGDSLAGLQVVFAGRADAGRFLQAARAAPAQPVLLVTEAEGALAQGSIINFVVTGGRVRFEIALDNAERRALRLSSRLLTVAQSVRTVQP
jgi:hypothetical protein